MNRYHRSTYQVLQQSLKSVATIRKVKLYPRVRTVTVVTYYKHTDTNRSDYIGTAYTLDLMTFTTSSVSLAHTNHAPPAGDEEEQETEVDPQPPYAIGCSI